MAKPSYQEFLSYDLLHRLISYDPDTGLLTWRNRTADLFVAGFHSAEGQCRAWNTRYAGKEAIGQVKSDGCKKGFCLGRMVSSHRVIIKMMTGVWPDETDHENGIRSDNRWVNLRNTSRVGNNQNCAIGKNNTSGAKGVTWRSSIGKWRARVSENGVRTTIGNFTEFQDAVDARKVALAKLGYHPNHGRKPAHGESSAKELK